MTKFPEVAFPGTTVANAKAAMEKWGIRHLPIVENDKLVGIVSERDLIPHLKDDKKLIRDLMITNIYKVHEEQYLQKVVLEMAENKYGCALCVNGKDEIVGVFTTTDALFWLSRILAGKDFANLRLQQLNWASANYMI